MVVVLSRETAGKNFARDAYMRLHGRWSPRSQMKIARLLHSLLKGIQEWIAVAALMDSLNSHRTSRFKTHVRRSILCLDRKPAAAADTRHLRGSLISGIDLSAC